MSKQTLTVADKEYLRQHMVQATLDELAAALEKDKITIAHYIDAYRADLANELTIHEGHLLAKFLFQNNGQVMVSLSLKHDVDVAIMSQALNNIFEGKSKDLLVQALNELTKKNPDLEETATTIINRWSDLIELNDNTPVVCPTEVMAKYQAEG